MAITRATLTQGSSGTDVTSATTASVAPAGNRLLLLSVAGDATSGVDNTPTVTGNGLTWVEITGMTQKNNSRGQYVFRAMGASPSSGTIVIDFSGQTQAKISWGLEEFDGVDTSGTNGSGAIGNNDKAAAFGATSVTVTLAAVAGGNATFGSLTTESSGTSTAGSGYTKLADQDHAGSNPYHFSTEWRSDGNVTVNFTFGATANLYINGAEIVAAAAGVVRKSLLLGVG